MDLVQKGAEANLESVKQLMVTMKWTSAADFDLAALWQKKDGEKGMVYFGAKGDLNAHPWMKLSGDAGVGDTAGANEEQMRVTSLETMAHVHLVVWDYGAVKAGSPARFNNSDVKVEIMDDQGHKHSAALDTGDTGNVLVLAEIDNTNPMGAKLINESKVGTLKGLTNSEQVWAIANQ